MIALLERFGERVLNSVVPQEEAVACGITYTPAPAKYGPYYYNAYDPCHNPPRGCAWDCRCSAGIQVVWGSYCK